MISPVHLALDEASELYKSPITSAERRVNTIVTFLGREIELRGARYSFTKLCIDWNVA
jgi:hypothetical protein